jgi:hypothetical protein
MPAAAPVAGGPRANTKAPGAAAVNGIGYRRDVTIYRDDRNIEQSR